jgi:16S rRNA processing protein RimM
LWTDVVERLVPGSVLASVRGPLRVVTSRPLGGERDRYLVQFEDVVDRAGAERLHGVELSAEALDVPGALWVHELVGASVRDVGSGADLGRVSSVEANPASDLLVLESGSLIPVRFVVRLDAAAHEVEVEVPEGLLEL